MASIRDNMKRTAQAQLDGYRKWDLDAIMAPRAEECTYRYLPESLERPAMNNDQFREYFATILPLLTGFSVQLDYEIYDEEKRTSVVHGFSDANSAIGPYRMEVVMFMSFNETGDKIVKVEEMVDSRYMTDYLSKLAAHMQLQAGSA